MESEIIQLIARDRLEIPLSSMYQKVKRVKKKDAGNLAEEHLYFGVNPGCRLTTDDYITALQSTGLSEKVSRELYPDLIKVSRKLAKASEEKRSVIVGKYAQD